MIQPSTNYACCVLVEGCTYRVIRKGSAKDMRSACKKAKREYSDRSYCVFLTSSKQVGDFIS